LDPGFSFDDDSIASTWSPSSRHQSDVMARVLSDARVWASTTVIAGLLAVALWPNAIAVDLARVSRGALVVTIDEEGRTRVRDRFVVTAPVTGRVLRIELEPGDRVTRGAIIARIQAAAPTLLDARSRAEADAALKSAQARADVARANEERARVALAHATRDLARSRDLHTATATTAEHLEARETQVALAAETASAAAFAVRAAAADVERARTRLATFQSDVARTVPITAPIDGVVLERLRVSDGVISAGEPLVELGDVTRLEVVTPLLSADAVRLRAGATATIEDWGGDETLAATVRRIEPAGFTKMSALGVEEQRVNVVLDFEETGEDDVLLGDGYRVGTRIVLSHAADVVKVPTSALIRDRGRWAVYTADAGHARRTIVELGRHTAREAEVTSGLSEGAIVVVHPSDLLRDGARITNRATP
jgi:HlyD family secretion protein